MKMKAEEIQQEWETLIGYIHSHITGDRKENLLIFYTKYQDRLMLMPAAHMI